MINLQDPESRAAATGEYVLGTLSLDDYSTFRQALAQSSELQAEVYAWQDRLLGLSALAAPLTPSPQLWQRIDTSLNAIGSAEPRLPRSTSAVGMPWWQKLGWWQGLSGLALAACLVLTVLLVQRGAEAPMGARYLAVLQSPQDGAAGWLVEVQAGGKLRLQPMSDTAAPPPGRSLQFWTKPQGAASPTSLGLVRAGQLLELPVSRLPGVGAQQLFEITLEPENGSPSGRPTGPILYVGRTIAL